MFRKIFDDLKYCKNKRFDTIAGTLSFFFILSFVPLLYLCVSLYVNICDWLNLSVTIPEVIQTYISFDVGASASIFFIITTIYSASKFFTQLRKTGEIVYNVKKPRITIKTQLFSCLFVILLMLMVCTGFLVISVGNTFFKFAWAKSLVTILTYIVILLMVFGFLCIINKNACQLDVKLKNLYGGILFSLAYVTIVSVFFIIYVTYVADFEKLYGVFSTIVIAFLYVYLMMQGIVIGIIKNEKKLKE